VGLTVLAAKTLIREDDDAADDADDEDENDDDDDDDEDDDDYDDDEPIRKGCPGTITAVFLNEEGVVERVDIEWGEDDDDDEDKVVCEHEDLISIVFDEHRKK
jgi:hypothetical protein